MTTPQGVGSSGYLACDREISGARREERADDPRERGGHQDPQRISPREISLIRGAMTEEMLSTQEYGPK
ncbi:hypothetical protein ACFY6U_52045 [Streptomyces sp. NPDC013157]|uniref:hypothetical protein n=1 Tax=Streptomyces sp. NPDC013157 TaxID=3364861 RepID=UPI0036C31E0D